MVKVIKFRVSPADAERFLKRFRRGAPTDCWEWRGCRNSQGRGTFYINGKTLLAPRIAFYVFKFNPKNKYVLHTCDNGGCVNPSNLFLGTASDNSKDAVKKGRIKSIFINGNVPKNAKITKVRAVQIKKQYVSGGISQQAIADKFGISQDMVSLIVLGKAWK